MSSALAVQQQPTALSEVRVTRLSREQIELLKDTIAQGATDGELQLFTQVCDRLGLDPFSKQIYLVKRWNAELQREVAAHQVSIDGFRLIAQRTGEYEGQAPIEWCGADGKWTDVWLLASPPVAARARVFRRGFKEPVTAVARFEAYAQRKKDGGLTNMWRKMGEVMIGKCAEALALRKAFPAELSGVYTDDEMAQANNEAEVISTSKSASEPAKTAVEKTKEQVRRKAGAGKLGAVLKRISEATSLEELNAVADDARKLKGDELIAAREAFAKRKADIEFADEPPHDADGVVTDEQPDADHEETEAGSRG